MSLPRVIGVGASTIATAACVSALLPGAAAAAGPVWLCKPGIPNNPCEPDLTTTLVSPSGQALGVKHVKAPKHPKIDCFYVYPTVSKDAEREPERHGHHRHHRRG